MRHGKIIWHAVIAMSGLLNAMPAQAAAPPVPERAGASVSEACAPMAPRDWLEQWQKLDELRQPDCKALIASFRADWEAPDFSSVKGREFTIVVRIEERDRGRSAPGASWLSLCPAMPPAHAVVRRWHDDGSHDQAEEDAAVLESLQRKLMELHEEGFFQVALDAQGTDRTGVNVQYQPVNPLPPPVFNFGPGFSR